MNTVSYKQINFIKRLAEERDLPAEMDSVINALTADTSAGNEMRQTVSTRQASQLIDELMAIPARPVVLSPERQADAEWLLANHQGNGFLTSLAGQFNSKGNLSDRQWACVRENVEKDQANAAAAAVARQAHDVELTPGVFVVNGTEFRRVAESDAGHLTLYVWTGRRFRKATDDERVEMGTDACRPATAEEAAGFGFATSRCSFCGRPLKVGASQHVGYGPICADRHGLPWGHEPTPEERNAAIEAYTSIVDPEAQTAAQRVEVVGPNLRDQSQGTMEVHSPDCPSRYRNSGNNDAAHPYVIEADSVEDVSRDVYYHQAEESGHDVDQYHRDIARSGEFHVHSCVSLPVLSDEPGQAAA